MIDHRVRARVLIPITAAFATLVLTHVVGVLVTQRTQLEARLMREVESVEAELAHREENDSDLLLSTLSAIAINPQFKDAFLSGDRDRLYALTRPFFEELQRSHGVTHLYFSDPSRVTMLRVHRPELFGDSISRYTTLRAASTGEPFVGLDLGRFRGLFTLRAVTPWRDNGDLIGFVELGMEVAGLTEQLATYAGVELVLTLDKAFVERAFWEDGMRFLGRTPDWDRYPDRVLIESTMQRVPAAVETALRQRGPTEQTDGEARIRFREADGRRYLGHFIPVTDASGRPLAEITVLLDVTAAHAAAWRPTWVLSIIAVGLAVVLFVLFFSYLGRVEAQIIERESLQTQLRRSRKGEALGRLTGGIAHTFNNLLTTIRAYADLAYHTPGAGEVVQDHLLKVQQGTETAASFVSKLLAVSRNQPINPLPIDLNGLVGDMVDVMSQIIGDDIELTFAPDPDLGVVRADPGLIQQVVLDLVVNARDAIGSKGRIAIRTEAVPASSALQLPNAGEHAALVVSDSGPGIPEEEHDLVFEPFYTTKGVGEGTGLGLSIAKGIAEQHGGAIALESRMGLGTEFRVLLPTTSDPIPANPSVTGIAPDVRSMERVLVVEDEPAVRDVVTMALRRQGYSVWAASNADEAHDVARVAGDLDILVADVMMPGKTGPVLYQELKEERPDLRVLYISGQVSTNVVSALQRSESLLLEKPFSIHELARSVRLTLDRKPSRAARN